MLQNLIDTFEELKKYVFIINRGVKKTIIIKFKDENFYHLVGLHKINIDMFFPKYIKTKSRKYEFMKKNIKKFDGIIKNQIKEKNILKLRIETFPKIFDLLKNDINTSLYDLKKAPLGSLYNGDYGLLKIYENVNCLLCLKSDSETENIINSAPQSWMADTRVIQLIKHKRPIYMQNINHINLQVWDEKTNEVFL